MATVRITENPRNLSDAELEEYNKRVGGWAWLAAVGVALVTLPVTVGFFLGIAGTSTYSPNLLLAAAITIPSLRFVVVALTAIRTWNIDKRYNNIYVRHHIKVWFFDLTWAILAWIWYGKHNALGTPTFGANPVEYIFYQIVFAVGLVGTVIVYYDLVHLTGMVIDKGVFDDLRKTLSIQGIFISELQPGFQKKFATQLNAYYRGRFNTQRSMRSGYY